MKKFIVKLNKRGPAPYEAEGFRSGFVILFAVTLASLMLAIGLGVADVALKQAKFSTSGLGTNDAFFATDTGIECALMNDKTPSTTFITSTGAGGTGTLNCLGNTIQATGGPTVWNFVIAGLGSSNQSCAVVNVTKTASSDPNRPGFFTSIVSKGYNVGDANCNSTNDNRVQRELDANY